MAAPKGKPAASGDSCLKDGKSSAGCPAEAAANSRIYSLDELETMATVGKFTCAGVGCTRLSQLESGERYLGVILFRRAFKPLR